MVMRLTPEQQAILDGERGITIAHVMKTLVMYGNQFGAQGMIPVTGKYGHISTGFALSGMKPYYKLLDQLIKSGSVSSQSFTVNPAPTDKRIPVGFVQNLLFKIMFAKQSHYNALLKTMGLLNERAFTCTCYMKEVGNIPEEDDILSWSESSAVVYANSVLGARCNRNPDVIDLFGSILGFVPYFGLLTDEGRMASWVVEVRTEKMPEASVLGSAIGMKVMDGVPFIKGLDRWVGIELTQDTRDFLKDMGAAAAVYGAVGLYHAEYLTPEAIMQGDSLIAEDAQIYVIDDAELERVKSGYPLMWKDPAAKPKLAFFGCPHLSLKQLVDNTGKIVAFLAEKKRRKVKIPTVFTAAPAVLDAFEKTPEAGLLRKTGVVTSHICPLMYLSNPMYRHLPVITNSSKLRTYTTARYMTNDEILSAITSGVS